MRTAVIPAAGQGTRMREVTGGRAKELLSLGRRTALERLVEEAREVADRVIVVVCPDKQDLAEKAREIGAEVTLQREPLGLAHAVACAELEGDVLVLLGDGPFLGPSPLPRMAELLEKGIEGAVCVESVPTEERHRYGIVRVNTLGGVEEIVEKPPLGEAPSEWAVCARYAFGPRLTAWVNDAGRGWLGPSELGLTPVLNEAIRDGFDLKAVPLPPDTRRADVGSPEAYRRSREWPWPR